MRAGRIGDHHAVARAVHQQRQRLVHLRGLALRRHAGAHAQQQPQAAAGTEGRGRYRRRRQRLGQPHRDFGRLAVGHGVLQQLAQRAGRRTVDQFGRRPASQRQPGTEQVRSCMVGLDDAQRMRVQRQHRVGRHLEQQPVARFGLARPPVATLQLLLRIEKALLDGGDGAQVAAHRQQRAVAAQAQCRERHRHAVVGGQRDVHLAPPCHAGAAQVGQHQLDLAPRVAGHHVGPRPADPALAVDGDRCAAALRHALDDALVVDDQGDIAGQRDESLGQFSGTPGQCAEVCRLGSTACHGLVPLSAGQKAIRAQLGRLRKWGFRWRHAAMPDVAMEASKHGPAPADGPCP